MESTAAWAGPYELELASNWTAEEVAPAADDAHVWAPAVGHPLQYASIADIFGSSYSLQPYVVPASSYSSAGQGQLVEYNYYAAAATQHHDLETYMNSPEKLFRKKCKEFMDDAKLMKTKMHRYPPSIQALGDWCTVPKVVAIGPYHHGGDHLQKGEKMKHVAARYCIQQYKSVNNNSGLDPVQDMYNAVNSVAVKIYASGLYDKDVMAGIGYEADFLPMMFLDACFLVIYMLIKAGTKFERDLHGLFKSNGNDIAHDIMLLENQIPLQVVDAIMNKCTSEPLQKMKSFIARWRKDGFLQDRVVREWHPADWDQDYYNEAPHLLGLLRFYAVEKRSSRKLKVSSSDFEKMESISISAGAIELAEMGVFLTANETTELPDMGLATKCIFFAELFMAPLSLNDARASLLVNMAVLELCTTPNFTSSKAQVEDSAVCSYLLLLGMLMHREEDVHELRTRGILQGAGLTNKKTLDFFTSLQSLRKGRYYYRVMGDIASYRMNWLWIKKVYTFLYNNWKYVVAVVSAFGGFIGIFTALMRFKGAH